MSYRFRGSIAVWAETTILPTMLSESIDRPLPILDSETREELNFWGSPNLRNHVIHVDEGIALCKPRPPSIDRSPRASK
jgi:hypothetical protein